MAQWGEGAKGGEWRRDNRPRFFDRHSRESGNTDDCSQARRPKSSPNPSRRIHLHSGAYRGRFASKRALGTWKAHGFPASLPHRKTAKPPEVRHALTIRMLPNSPDAATDHAASQRGCQNAVIAALTFTGGFSAVRRRLREWLYDGADRSTPSQNQTGVRARFSSLMRWGLSLWNSGDLALSIDPTTLNRIPSGMRRGVQLPPEPWPPPDGVKVVCHPEIRNLPLQAHKGRGDLSLAIPSFAALCVFAPSR